MKHFTKAILISVISLVLCLAITVSCTILGAVISGGFTYLFEKPMYQASTTIYVNNKNSDHTTGLTNSDLSASVHLVKGYMLLAKSDTILTQVALNLNGGDPNGPYTTSCLREAISTTQVDDTVIFAIKVTHEDKYEAVKIADAVADVLVEAGPDVIMGTSASIIDNAQVPTAPCSPDYPSIILSGAAVGLSIGLALTIIFLGVFAVVLLLIIKKKSHTRSIVYYKKLYDDGIITKEEFETKKRQLLDL